jgi:dTDP-4-dehydrorhamnose 3,5-epimerase
MNITETYIKGLFVLEPRLFEDDRGYFYESFHLKKFAEKIGQEPHFVQDNHSYSKYGVLRGMHFQYGEGSQSKLIRVLSGKVLDVVVDLRKDSTTYGKTFSIELSAENKKQLFVPRGFAHGFVTLSKEGAEFVYKCDNFYYPKLESGIIYNDKTLNIDWQIPKNQIIISAKDAVLPTFKEIDVEFQY